MFISRQKLAVAFMQISNSSLVKKCVTNLYLIHKQTQDGISNFVGTKVNAVSVHLALAGNISRHLFIRAPDRQWDGYLPNSVEASAGGPLQLVACLLSSYENNNRYDKYLSREVLEDTT